jgi:hypothetical protein
MVLLFALLCLIAIEVTTVGVHFVALQELRAGRAAVRVTQLRLAAQSAASRTLAAWPLADLPSLTTLDSMTVPPAEGTAPGGIEFGATIQRLGEDLFLVRASARSPLRETAAIGALVALAHPADLAALVSAAVTTPRTVTVHAGGRITAADICPTGGGGPPGAALILPAAEALHADGSTITGPVRIAEAMQTDRIGIVSRALLDRIAEPISSAALTPSPSILDGCTTADQGNWGDPGDAASACAAYHPILRRHGDLLLSGGVGQGILLVDGDLRIAATRFDGIILVRGDLALDSAAVVSGALIVDGAVTVAGGAHVDFDRCAVTESLRDVRVRGPFRPVGRMWIPLF